MKKWILREFEHVQKHVQIERRKNKWIIKYLEFSFISPIFNSFERIFESIYYFKTI